MDYNYVRMRDALKRGDLQKAEEYKLLYETGKARKKSFSLIDYTIILLLSVTVLLGIYILHSELQHSENNANNDVTKTVEVSE